MMLFDARPCEDGYVVGLFRRRMRVGVYVDAFNLYYGARDHCGRRQPGWRWLDIVGLVETQLAARVDWKRAAVTRLVYCTAERDKEGDPSSLADQRSYVHALADDYRVVVEYGQYNPKHGKGVLAEELKSGKRRRYRRVPYPAQGVPSWFPHGKIRGPEGDDNITIRYASFEEKGSDVNLATHLIADILGRRIDAAVIVSNDGDLRYPVELARTRVPVAVLNPSRRPTSEMLQGNRWDGVGRHWWMRLTHDHFRAHQLPEKVGAATRPADW